MHDLDEFVRNETKLSRDGLNAEKSSFVEDYILVNYVGLYLVLIFYEFYLKFANFRTDCKNSRF